MRTLRTNLDEEIQKLRAQIEWKEKIKRLIDQYSDLGRHVDRWGNEEYILKGITRTATDCTIGRTCGCCHDAPLYAYPFVIIDGVTVYDDPKGIHIGSPTDKVGMCGDEADENLREHLESLELPTAIIEKIEKYFADNPLRNEDE